MDGWRSARPRPCAGVAPGVRVRAVRRAAVVAFQASAVRRRGARRAHRPGGARWPSTAEERARPAGRDRAARGPPALPAGCVPAAGDRGVRDEAQGQADRDRHRRLRGLLGGQVQPFPGCGARDRSLALGDRGHRAVRHDRAPDPGVAGVDRDRRVRRACRRRTRPDARRARGRHPPRARARAGPDRLRAPRRRHAQRQRDDRAGRRGAAGPGRGARRGQGGVAGRGGERARGDDRAPSPARAAQPHADAGRARRRTGRRLARRTRAAAGSGPAPRAGRPADRGRAADRSARRRAARRSSRQGSTWRCSA